MQLRIESSLPYQICASSVKESQEDCVPGTSRYYRFYRLKHLLLSFEQGNLDSKQSRVPSITLHTWKHDALSRQDILPGLLRFYGDSLPADSLRFGIFFKRPLILHDDSSYHT